MCSYLRARRCDAHEWVSGFLSISSNMASVGGRRRKSHEECRVASSRPPKEVDDIMPKIPDSVNAFLTSRRRQWMANQGGWRQQLASQGGWSRSDELLVSLGVTVTTS